MINLIYQVVTKDVVKYTKTKRYCSCKNQFLTSNHMISQRNLFFITIIWETTNLRRKIVRVGRIVTSQVLR